MLATPECVHDSNWYPDSGATNHLTADPANLMHKADYFGPEQVHMGNGKGLQIKNVGHSVFHSPFTPKLLSLSQLLHVPSITKNLMSVSKFANDNCIYFEFHPKCCFVKDQHSQKTLLEGKLKGGLYVFDNT